MSTCGLRGGSAGLLLVHGCRDTSEMSLEGWDCGRVNGDGDPSRSCRYCASLFGKMVSTLSRRKVAKSANPCHLPTKFIFVFISNFFLLFFSRLLLGDMILGAAMNKHHDIKSAEVVDCSLKDVSIPHPRSVAQGQS